MLESLAAENGNPLMRRVVRLESSQELLRAQPESRQAQIASPEEQVSV